MCGVGLLAFGLERKQAAQSWIRGVRWCWKNSSVLLQKSQYIIESRYFCSFFQGLVSSFSCLEMCEGGDDDIYEFNLSSNSRNLPPPTLKVLIQKSKISRKRIVFVVSILQLRHLSFSFPVLWPPMHSFLVVSFFWLPWKN